MHTSVRVRPGSLRSSLRAGSGRYSSQPCGSEHPRQAALEHRPRPPADSEKPGIAGRGRRRPRPAASHSLDLLRRLGSPRSGRPRRRMARPGPGQPVASALSMSLRPESCRLSAPPQHPPRPPACFKFSGSCGPRSRGSLRVRALRVAGCALRVRALAHKPGTLRGVPPGREDRAALQG